MKRISRIFGKGKDGLTKAKEAVENGSFKGKVEACHKHDERFYEIINLTTTDTNGNKLSMMVCEWCLKEMWRIADPEQKKTLESQFKELGINDIE
tara:strand:+ start:211 stop:495 length:285 start_codon:yes stop_codon:yes gene_type:complete